MNKVIPITKPAWLIDREQGHAPQKPLGEAGRYWDNRSGLFPYCVAVIQTVLLHGWADKEYLEAKQSWGLPGCQTAIENIQLGYQNRKMHNRADLLRVGGSGVNDTDLLKLNDAISRFIAAGFNRDIDRANEHLKVVPDPESLLFIVTQLWTLADFLGINLADFREYRPLVRRNKTYNTDNIMQTKPNSGDERVIYRELTKLFKKQGRIIHDQKLLKYADQWYKCRVNPGSIEAYIDEVSLISNIIPEHGNVETAIAPYNEATGYPRKWRK